MQTRDNDNLKRNLGLSVSASVFMEEMTFYKQEIAKLEDRLQEDTKFWQQAAIDKLEEEKKRYLESL